MADAASSSESTDIEGDQFEEAQDYQAERSERSSSRPTVVNIRSLTGERRPSSSSNITTPKASKQSPVMDTESEDGDSIKDSEKEEDKKEEEDPDSSESGSKDGQTPKSPLLTSHRLSTTESLDEVNLEGHHEETASLKSRSSMVTSKDQGEAPPALPPKNAPSRLKGLSGSISSGPWAPPPPPKQNEAPAPAPPRKLTSPFSWLTRNTSKDLGHKENIASPPLHARGRSPNRRDTTASVSTLSSNPELMLSRLDEGGEINGSMHGGSRQRNSLRDRFKMLRLREEIGITMTEDGNDISTPDGGSGALVSFIEKLTNLGLGIVSPTSLTESVESVMSPKEYSSSPPSSLPSTINPNLPPGTAAGVAAGPSSGENTVPVDWDLWQAVVYEGPAAVARTSPEELAQAIAGGIPSAIRGVVWQVLAQSKNEELEIVYRDLVARGTDHDPERLSVSSGNTLNGHTNGSIKEKDSNTSSSSSIHSDQSTPTSGFASPLHEKDPEMAAKLQAAAIAERKRKAKEDAAALNKLEKAIKRDLGARTSYSKFAVSAGLQDGLFGVCKAYALFDEAVGYAQGMNFLAMPLLFNMPEEEAFCLLVRLMNQYHLRDMFIQDMPGLHLHLYQFERLLEDLEPALYCHLHRRGVNPQLYATQWFLTLFAYRFPLQLVLRVYDLILSEGLEGAILKFAIVLMQKNVQALMEMNDMSALTTFLKERLFDVYIDKAPSSNSILESGFFGSSGGVDKEIYRADMLVQDACAVKITPEMLKTYTIEWQEKTRAEKERETELFTLKGTNQQLAHKVRLLEETAEKSDQEHVQMASELVRVKVENEELNDMNESLKGQVVELRKVVDKQPEEVENRLKDQMDRIMQSNLEVQNENRTLEEQMAEMEKDLVATKMQYAEINAAHEDLKRKWNDLRKALDV
ncbi:MAG: GTPase-activating protein [Cirrosporium novae-zelandiae]|nr:MAG: GTPase-activating protein [Cirrosporium novae-zelandiae]